MNDRSSPFAIILTSIDVVLLFAGLVALGVAFGGLEFIEQSRLEKIFFAFLGPILVGISVVIFANRQRVNWWNRRTQILLSTTIIFAVGCGTYAHFVTLEGMDKIDDLESRVEILSVEINNFTDRLDQIENMVQDQMIDDENQQASEPAKETEPTEPEIESSPEPTQPPDDFVRIPWGKYTIGSKELGMNQNTADAHTVDISEFWIQKYEVTNLRYRACESAEESGCTVPKETSLGSWPAYYTAHAYDDYPVVNVSFDQASSYCAWIGGRLPSEEEWEAAARGQDGRTYVTGPNKPTNNVANLMDLNKENAPGKVTAFREDISRFGVHNLIGNVSEWTNSWYVSFEGNLEPFDYTGTLRVIRGADYWTLVTSNNIRVYARQGVAPTTQLPNVGFRCVWTPEDSSTK